MFTLVRDLDHAERNERALQDLTDTNRFYMSNLKHKYGCFGADLEQLDVVQLLEGPLFTCIPSVSVIASDSESERHLVLKPVKRRTRDSSVSYRKSQRFWC